MKLQRSEGRWTSARHRSVLDLRTHHVASTVDLAMLDHPYEVLWVGYFSFQRSKETQKSKEQPISELALANQFRRDRAAYVHCLEEALPACNLLML